MEESSPFRSVIRTGDTTAIVGVRHVRRLGRGRSAVANLVEVTDPEGRTRQLVEKVFQPGLLTRLIYWLCFQAPYGYRWCEDAVAAAFYRRRVMARLLQLSGAELQIAAPCYWRWSRRARAFVLGTEFIAGHGLRPDRSARDEYLQLLQLMRRTERLFCAAGLIGSGWQVATGALVSTANFIIHGGSFWLIDGESGLPALLVPRYWWLALRFWRPPLYDDAVPAKLTQWLSARSSTPPKELIADLEALARHEREWRRSEPAVWRRGPAFLMPSRMKPILKARVQQWHRAGAIDEAHRRRCERSVTVTMATALAGVLPNPLGDFCRGLYGSARQRRLARRLLRQRTFRRRFVSRRLATVAAGWHAAGRIRDDKRFTGIGCNLVCHWLLSVVASASIHRLLTDRALRRLWLRGAGRIWFSEALQDACATYLLRSWLHQWLRDERLTTNQARVLVQDASSGLPQEYLRCFTLHLSLKLLAPISYSLRVAGLALLAAAFVDRCPDCLQTAEFSRRSVHALLLTLWHEPLIVVLILNTAIARTVITLWRQLRRPRVSYGVALLVGAVPIIGSVAYPLQTYWRCPELSGFLLRHFAARAAQYLPIYGGKHTRTEVWIVRLADLAITIFGLLRRPRPSADAVEPGACLSPLAAAPAGGDELILALQAHAEQLACRD